MSACYDSWKMERTLSEGDEQTPKDPGAEQPLLQAYNEEDFQEHRADTIHFGAHRRPKKERTHHKEPSNSRGRGSIDVPVTPPSQRVHFILGEDAQDDESHEIHPIFSEMEELVLGEGDIPEWKETARWIKFEEDVEEGGNRWSKPHVATLSLHSLFELRSLLLNGTVLLEMEASTLEQVADLFIDNMVSAGSLTSEKKDKVRETVLRKHKHLIEKKGKDNIVRLPIIRSLADIGRINSSSKSGGKLDNMDRIPSAVYMSGNQSNGDLEPILSNHHFMRKIPPGAEACNILVGEVEFLDKTISAFVRLNEGTFFGDLTEVPIPTRFIFVLLGPSGGITSFHEVGRVMGTLMSDEVFHQVAYKAKNRNHLLAAVDEFMGALTVLPPGKWDPTVRIEPPAATPSQEDRKRPPEAKKDDFDEEKEKEKIRIESGLSRSGRLFGGLINDVKRKAPWFWSDIKDAFAVQCIASWIFLYFACLAPIVTFGGLLAEATGKNMAAMESLVSGFICGIIFGLFSGQPLNILGPTGPVLVLETIVYEFCRSWHWNFLSFRLWVGAWMAFDLLLLVAFDASAYVCYITRFTEENFACLIAFIFVYKAIENVFHLKREYPFEAPALGGMLNCSCNPPLDNATYGNWTESALQTCLGTNGTVVGGEDCIPSEGYPNVFLMSILLFLGTFLISVELKEFKNSLFFPATVRQFISDFSVIIAILLMTLLDYFFDVDTPKLEVPSEFKPTLPDRGWLIAPFLNPVWTIPLAAVPALLGTILIFMDQQITAVIVNRKENKLKKGCGYHLDLFVLSILIVICSVMGLPWFVAATVLSINHVDSLKLESESAAPGEKPQFLGVREQRVTQVLIFLMIGLSVLITPILGFIPMPVLFGVFLYMGVASLKGLQFFDRILIMFMPEKYQPEYEYIRQVPILRVHLFTIIQLICFILMWVMESFHESSLLFPLMLVVLVGIRKLLDYVFTQRELKILDDIMPQMNAKGKNKEEGGPPEENGDMKVNGNVEISQASINISEEVNKSGIWKLVNRGKNKKKESFENNTTLKKDSVNEVDKTRPSAMREMDEIELLTGKRNWSVNV